MTWKPRRRGLLKRSLVQREYLARERRAHDLDGTAGDHEAARLPPHPLDRHLRRRAEAAMKLHAAIGRLEAELGAVDLGHERLVPLQRAVVEFTCGAVGEELPGLQLGVEVGNRELHGLPALQRPSEGAALRGVARYHL